MKYWDVKIVNGKLKSVRINKETLMDMAMATGRVIVLRNHDKYISLGNGICLSWEGKIRLWKDYTVDLYPINDVTGQTEVMAIYDCVQNLQEMNSLNTHRLLWERGQKE